MTVYKISQFGKDSADGLVTAFSWVKRGEKAIVHCDLPGGSIEVPLDSLRRPVPFLYFQFVPFELEEYQFVILDGGGSRVMGMVIAETNTTQELLATFCAYSGQSDPHENFIGDGRYRITIGEDQGGAENPFKSKKSIGWEIQSDKATLTLSRSPSDGGDVVIKEGDTGTNSLAKIATGQYGAKWKESGTVSWDIVLMTSAKAMIGAVLSRSTSKSTLEEPGVFGAEYP